MAHVTQAIIKQFNKFVKAGYKERCAHVCRNVKSVMLFIQQLVTQHRAD